MVKKPTKKISEQDNKTQIVPGNVGILTVQLLNDISNKLSTILKVVNEL